MSYFDLQSIFSVNEKTFEQTALSIFKFQFEHQKTYREFCIALGKTPDKVQSLNSIPFLPISFFKTHKIISSEKDAATVFESSGTTGSTTSKHFVANDNIYIKSFLLGFKQFYGAPEDYHIVALLPSYLERKNSSLVFMVEYLMRQSNKAENGFFIHNFEQLAARLGALEFQQEKTLLIGVTYALLDFAEQFPMKLQHTTVMETGGMKGRKKEMLRAEIHEKLRAAFQLPAVHSEYGMTELLSQAYSNENGIFKSPPWMKVLVRDVYNPMNVSLQNRNGGLNVIDLANVYSCSFIATEDLGIVHSNGSFEVLGRINNSDVRGCSLMYAN